MKEATCPKKSPYVLKAEKKKYAWCSCGKSTKQPFCDGSHINTDFSPVIITIDKQVGQIAWCGCKTTKNPPYCDASHCKL